MHVSLRPSPAAVIGFMRIHGITDFDVALAQFAHRLHFKPLLRLFTPDEMGQLASSLAHEAQRRSHDV